MFVFILNPRAVLGFRKEKQLSLAEAISVYGRFRPLIGMKADLLHFHHLQMLRAPVIDFLDYFELPWVVSVRGYDLNIRPTRSEKDREHVKNALQHAVAVHAVSDGLKRMAVSLGISETKISVIRRTAEVEAKRTASVEAGHPVWRISTIGRFHWQKGYVFGLQALALLTNRGYSVRYDICGSGSRDEEDELRYWTQFLGLQEVVRFRGFCDDLKIDQVLEGTHIYLQPSINEGIPNALLRAFAYAIPIVATNVGGIPEVVKHGVHGLLVEPGNGHELAKALEALITDSHQRERILAADRRHVSLDYKNEMREYEALYAKAIKNKWQERHY